LSKRPEWRSLGSERTNRIISILAERIEQDARGRCADTLDPEVAATSLIATLLYLKSIGSGARERDPQLVETVVRQWLHGILQE
jgi:hypothetical protein